MALVASAFPTRAFAASPAPGVPCPDPATQVREFEPINDVHIGVITSSVGGHGADSCSNVPYLEYNPRQEDMSRLLTRGKNPGETGYHDVSTYENKGFLNWDPQATDVPPGESNVSALDERFSELVRGAGEDGCGFEASLESWYRFLVDPAPYAKMIPCPCFDGDTANLCRCPDGLDTLVLQQRADMIRRDSLLAVVMLSDENDCSIMEWGQNFLALQALDGTNPFHVERGTNACESDPWLAGAERASRSPVFRLARANRSVLRSTIAVPMGTLWRKPSMNRQTGRSSIASLFGRHFAIALLGLAPAATQGCTCEPPPEPLGTDGDIALTWTRDPESSHGSRSRLWAPSSPWIASFAEDDRTWHQHALPQVLDQLYGDVSAVWWSRPGDPVFDSWERVYSAGSDGRIHEGGFDAGSDFAWTQVSGPPIELDLTGRLRALVGPVPADGSAPTRYVAAVTGARGAEEVGLLQIYLRDAEGFDVEYLDDAVLVDSPRVCGAVLGSTPWFFAVDQTRHLRVWSRTPGGESNPQWSARTVESLPEGASSLRGDCAALRWKPDGSTETVSVLLQTDANEVWEGRFVAPNTAPQWFLVDPRSTPARFTLTAATGAGGTDVAYLRDSDAQPGVQLARWAAPAGPWQRTEWMARPPDIATQQMGPLALRRAGLSGAQAATVFMLAEEVDSLPYAYFSTLGEAKWHNLLDPFIPTGRSTVNQSGHLTEAMADEKRGNVLLAAIREPDDVAAGFDYFPGCKQDVRVAWSTDDAHTWEPTFGLWTDYGNATYGGTSYIQGDPTAVVLNSDNRWGYVLMHELRVDFSSIWAGPNICSSRIRLFRLRQGDPQLSQEILPGNSDWELSALQQSPTADCLPTNDQFLDHPFMAVGPDDVVHIAWMRSASSKVWGESMGVFYRALDGKTGTWMSAPLTVEANVDHVPYIVADPVLPGTSYVAFDSSHQDPGSPSEYSHSIHGCTPSGCVPVGVTLLDTIPHGGLNFGIDFGPVTLRTPAWAIAVPAAGAAEPGIMLIVYMANWESGSHGLRYRYSADHGATWSSPKTIDPMGPYFDRFGPNLSMQGDGTGVLTYWEQSPPGSGQNVKAMIATWNPLADTWRVEEAAHPYAFDLSKASRRPGDRELSRFIGDYNWFTGGLTHVHSMRSAALQTPTPRCLGTCLWTAANSDVCF